MQTWRQQQEAEHMDWKQEKVLHTDTGDTIKGDMGGTEKSLKNHKKYK